MSDEPVGRGGMVVADVIPAPRIVAFDAPWAWLGAGWQDLWANPRLSLTYGAVFAAIAAGLTFGLFAIDALPLFLALCGGFLLLGPLFAVGLYEASRRRERGDHPTLREVAMAPLFARGQLAFAGALLLVIFFLWLRAAFLLLMLFLGGSGIPPPSEFTRLLLFTPHGLGLLVVGTAVGAILAAFVFATTALSIPMLASRRVDVFTAAVASVRAVLLNLKPMALWAALIVVIMAAGFATVLAGLVIAFPLIGHATWHAYADVFAPRPGAPENSG
ncbi:MAG: DUF2189 domain-containing protein [Hyphomicrobiaceae bacterium]